MNIRNPQSWFDFPMMSPMDPRQVIQTVLLDDNTGTLQNGSFVRASNWLKNIAWVQPPVSLAATGAPFAANTNPQDYQAAYAVQLWNSSHGIIRPSNQIALPVQKIIILKQGSAFSTTIFLDWAGGVSSQDILLSLRDNSLTAGEFQNAGLGTVPVFQFPTAATYSGTGRRLVITTPRDGRYSMCLRIVDNAGNWSMFEMEWLVVP